MIKSIIFDIGNVLFGYDPQHVLNQILPNNPYHTQYLDHFINAQVWQDLDRGTVDESTLSDQLSTKIPDPNLKQNLQSIIDNFIHHMSLIEDNRTLFLTLKKHIRYTYYPIFKPFHFQTFASHTHSYIKPMVPLYPLITT